MQAYIFFEKQFAVFAVMTTGPQWRGNAASRCCHEDNGGGMVGDRSERKIDVDIALNF
jgi:hypothetical protein